MKARIKPLSLSARTHYRTIEDVLGCRWSTAVLAAVAQGVQRPGALERTIPGISTKVLNERLRRLVEFQLLERTEYSGLPARVDYTLTPTGRKLVRLINSIHELNDEHARGFGILERD